MNPCTLSIMRVKKEDNTQSIYTRTHKFAMTRGTRLPASLASCRACTHEAATLSCVEPAWDAHCHAAANLGTSARSVRSPHAVCATEHLANTVELKNFYGGVGKLPPVQRATAYTSRCVKTKASAITPPAWFSSSTRSIASTTHTDFPRKRITLRSTSIGF